MSVAVLAIAIVLPAASVATTLDLPDRSTSDEAPTGRLDLSPTTLREAARSGPLASNGDTSDADHAPGDTKVIALPSIRPTCSVLLGVASLIAVGAACAKNHCAAPAATVPENLTISHVSVPAQPVGCQPRTIKLW